MFSLSMKQLQKQLYIRFSADGPVVTQNRFGVAGSVNFFNTNRRGQPKQFRDATDKPCLLDEHNVVYYYGEVSSAQYVHDVQSLNSVNCAD